MNERIKELAKAHLVHEEYTQMGWQECHKYEFDEDELTEFAELIVRECAEYASTCVTDPTRSYLIHKAIKQHFGVEEKENK